LSAGMAGMALFTLGNYEAALAELYPAITRLDRSASAPIVPGLISPRIHLTTFATTTLAECGRFEEADRVAGDSDNLVNSLGIPLDQVTIHWGLGYSLLRRGQIDGAIPLLERSLAVCREHHLWGMFPKSCSTLGYAYALAGRGESAMPLLNEAIAIAESPLAI